MRRMALIWAGACLLGFVLAGPAAAQTATGKTGGKKPAGGTPTATTPTGGTTGSTGGATTGGSTTGTTDGSPTTGFGLSGLFGLFGGVLTPEQESQIMAEAMATTETLVTLLAIDNPLEEMFLFFIVYEVYTIEAIIQELSGGTTAGGA